MMEKEQARFIGLGFRSRRFKVEDASSADEAPKTLYNRQQRFDLVQTYNSMPGKNVLHPLKEISSRIPTAACDHNDL